MSARVRYLAQRLRSSPRLLPTVAKQWVSSLLSEEDQGVGQRPELSLVDRCLHDDLVSTSVTKSPGLWRSLSGAKSISASARTVEHADR